MKQVFLKSKSSPTAKDTTFILPETNASALDKIIITELASHQDRKPKKTDDLKQLTTSLENLGISTPGAKEPLETIYWGDYYQIRLHVSFDRTSEQSYLLTPQHKFRCTYCRQLPPPGSLMLAVPYKYVSSHISEHVYAPECINVVSNITTGKCPEPKTSKSQKTSHDRLQNSKNAPKVNYFQRDVTIDEYDTYKDKMVTNDYFECIKPVCNFGCLFAKGKELSKVDPRFRNVNMLINQMYKTIFGKLPSSIPLTPDPDLLEEYGGTYTLEEYRKASLSASISTMSQYAAKAKSIIQPAIQLYLEVKRE